MLVLPRAARPSKTLWRWIRRLWQTASLVEFHEVDAGLLAAEAVQQHREGNKQPGHQADEPVIVRQLVKTGAILTAHAVEVEHLEVFL